MNPKNDMEQYATYLGDGVYASYDGYQIWLKTQRDAMHEIALDPVVFARLLEYMELLKGVGKDK